MDGTTVESLLGHLIRDRGILKRRDDVVATHGADAYYLRPRRPPVANAEGHLHADEEVDHIFECQMGGHALLQTREFHPLLRQLDLSGGSWISQALPPRCTSTTPPRSPLWCRTR